MDLADGNHTLKIVVLDKKMAASTGYKIYIERILVFNQTDSSVSHQ